MRLHTLMREAGLAVPPGEDPDLRGIHADSRRVGRGDLFLAYPGASQDGRAFISEALARGAAAVLCEPGPASRQEGAPLIEVPGLREAAPRLFNAWHGRPADRLFCVGITGTNGKSTTAGLAASMLRALGRKPVVLGTINYDLGGEALPAGLTTPGPEEFFALLRRGVDAGCDSLVMEVSSHALDQDRVRGIRFARAVFTNLTQDHLDYHPDLESYFQAKRRLFTRHLDRNGGKAVLNLDSEYGRRLEREPGLRAMTYSCSGRPADVRLAQSSLSLEGTRLRVDHPGGGSEFSSRLVGGINLENLLAAIALGFSLGAPAEKIALGIRDVTIPGRNERLPLPNGAFAVVDYAHTPDALDRVLQSLRPLVPGRLICLFGCGGDRDRGKRPQMGRIARERSDRVYVTSDNPRTEPPDAIVGEILAGMPDRTGVEVEIDRAAAIAAALAELREGDCLLIAGKGHEDYQIVGRDRRHFSDQEQVRRFISRSLPPSEAEPSAGGRGGG